MSTVEDDVAAGGTGQGIWANQLDAVIGSRVPIFAKLKRVAGPLERELGEDFADPAIASRIAEENEIRAAYVVLSHVGVVFDGKVATVVTSPFIGEAFQIGISPRTNRWVPGLACAANT